MMVFVRTLSVKCGMQTQDNCLLMFTSIRFPTSQLLQSRGDQSRIPSPKYYRSVQNLRQDRTRRLLLLELYASYTFLFTRDESKRSIHDALGNHFLSYWRHPPNE
jgi:hypothetical protein